MRVVGSVDNKREGSEEKVDQFRSIWIVNVSFQLCQEIERELELKKKEKFTLCLRQVFHLSHSGPRHDGIRQKYCKKTILSALVWWGKWNKREKKESFSGNSQNM